MQVVEVFLSPEQWKVVSRHWMLGPAAPQADKDDDSFGAPGFVRP
jgi:hypothetical protein